MSPSCNGPTYLPFILNGRNILLLTEYPCVLDYIFVTYLEKEDMLGVDLCFEKIKTVYRTKMPLWLTQRK